MIHTHHTHTSKVNLISVADRDIAERNFRAQEYLDRKQSKHTNKRAAMFFGIICLLEYAAILWLIGR
jgi:hypothetical protein